MAGVDRDPINSRSSSRRISTKGYYIYRAIPRNDELPFKRAPDRDRFNHALFRKTRRHLSDDEWGWLRSILEAYRRNCGYALPDDKLQDLVRHSKKLVKHLEAALGELRYFRSDATPEGTPTRTLGDFLSVNDGHAALHESPQPDRPFVQLSMDVEALLARTQCLLATATGADVQPGDSEGKRWVMGTHQLLWSVRTPWVRMVFELGEFAEELGIKPAVGGRETPFMRLVSEATQTMGRDFENERSGFRKAIQQALDYERF